VEHRLGRLRSRGTPCASPGAGKGQEGPASFAGQVRDNFLRIVFFRFRRVSVLRVGFDSRRLHHIPDSARIRASQFRAYPLLFEMFAGSRRIIPVVRIACWLGGHLGGHAPVLTDVPPDRTWGGCSSNAVVRPSRSVCQAWAEEVTSDSTSGGSFCWCIPMVAAIGDSNTASTARSGNSHWAYTRMCLSRQLGKSGTKLVGWLRRGLSH